MTQTIKRQPKKGEPPKKGKPPSYKRCFNRLENAPAKALRRLAEYLFEIDEPLKK